MIVNFERKTKRQKTEFQNGMKGFVSSLSKETPEHLTLSPVRKELDKEQGILHLFDLVQQNPGKGSRKVTIAVNTTGKARCHFFGEVRNDHEGAEYDHASVYDLKKSNLRHLFHIKTWWDTDSFLLLYKKIVDWVAAGN